MSEIKTFDTKKKAYEILEKMLYECATDMINAGIPIQTEKTDGIYCQEIKGTHALCSFGKNKNGDTIYSIIISDKFVEHIDDEVVLANVKNSIYHELLHTCPDCQSHNDNWLDMAVECDAKLGTHTRLRQDDVVYYNRVNGAKIHTYACQHCGFTFQTIKDYGKYVICPVDKEKAYKI